MSIHSGDNNELVQPFNEVVSTRQPWQFATSSYNSPIIGAPTLIATFVGFQNQPPNANINLVPTNSEVERLQLLNDWSRFVPLIENIIIN